MVVVLMGAGVGVQAVVVRSVAAAARRRFVLGTASDEVCLSQINAGPARWRVRHYSNRVRTMHALPYQ